MRTRITYARTAVVVALIVATAAALAAPQTKDAAPPLPSNLWAAQTSPTQITLGWGRATVPLPPDQKVPSVGTTAVPVSEYRIYRDRGDGRLEGLATLSGAATTAVVRIDGGGSGSTYQYAIAAFGESKTPIAKSAPPAATARFNPVTLQSGRTGSMDGPLVTAVQTARGEITVSWSEVAGATAYRIGRNAAPKGFQTLCQLCPTGAMIVDRSVADATGGAYTYSVEAYTPAGLTKPGTSNRLVVTRKGLDASAGDSTSATLAPTRLWAAQTGPAEITLVWRPPDNVASGKSTVLAYDIYEERDGRVRRVTRLTAAATRAIVGVARASTAPQQFSIAVVVDTTKGSTPDAAVRFNPVTPAIGDTQKPESPRSVTAAPARAGEMTVTWTAVPGATAYMISREKRPAGFQTICDLCPDVTTFNDPDALPGTVYRYAIAAYTASGLGPRALSNEVDLRAIDPKGTLGAPGAVKAAATAAGAVSVTWQAATGATGYRVARSVNSGTWKTMATLPTTVHVYTDTTPGLLKEQQVRYRVDSFNAAGQTQRVEVTLEVKTASP